MKLSTMATAVAVLTVAAGAASQAAEQSVAPETTASVPAISVSEDGELRFAPEFQRIVDDNDWAKTGGGCCGDSCNLCSCNK